MQALPATRRVCFGPFHLDFVRGELRKHGVRIRLSRQPFQVLETLIQAQGEVVTRDELRAKLWPQDQFGDFDHSLNVAVKKLRDCLGDSAAEPRYIATVERQGYRFVGVLAVGEDANRQPVAQATEKVEGLSLRSAVTAQQKSRKKMMAGIAIAAVVLAAIGSWRLVQSRPAPHVIRYTQLTHSGVVHPNQKLLTDGPRLYFIERDFAEHKSGAWVGKWMLTSGGPATSLNLPFEHHDLQDISPDGADLALNEYKGNLLEDLVLWMASTDGGAPRRLGRGAQAVAFTLDGRHVLYAMKNTIFESDRDGGNSRKLLDAPGKVLSLNPWGERLRFTIEQDDGLATWESILDGTRLHPVLPGWNAARPSWGGGWTPDGRWFVFSAARNGAQDLWVLDEKQPSRPIQLTSGPLEFRTPIFSRDGKEIFCVGTERRGELLRYNLATRQFLPILDGVSAEQVAYSRDGQWMAYITYPEGVLWRARADGSERRQLTATPMRVHGPHWSPDASQIAFSGQAAPGAPWKVRIVASGGGPSEEVMDPSGIRGIAWIPDGKSLMIGALEGGAVRLFDLERHTTSTILGSEGLLSPALSPDGRYLAGALQPGETLVVLDMASHQRRELARDAQYPTWSRDGQFIYFNSFAGSVPAMYRVRVADGVIEALFKLDEFAAAGNWGFWSSVMPDGSPLLMRDTGTVDLYALEWEPQ